MAARVQLFGGDAGQGQASSRELAPSSPRRAFGWGTLVGALVCGAVLAVSLPALKGAPAPGRSAKFAGAVVSEGDGLMPAGADEEIFELIPELVRAISADAEVREHTAAVAKQLDASMLRDPELREMAKALAAQVHDVMHSQKAKIAAARFADILEGAAEQFSEIMEETEDLPTMAYHMNAVFAELMKALMTDPKIAEMVMFASQEFAMIFEHVLSHEHSELVQSIAALKSFVAGQLLPFHELAGMSEASFSQASRAFMSLPSTGALHLGRSSRGAFSPTSPAAQHSPASRSHAGALSMQERGSTNDVAKKLFQNMFAAFLATTIAAAPPSTALHAFVAPALAADAPALAADAPKVAPNPYAKPEEIDYRDRATNVKSKEEVAAKKQSYVNLVGGLLVVAFVTPMVQYFFYVRDDPRRLYEKGEHFRSDAQPRSSLEEEAEENF